MDVAMLVALSHGGNYVAGAFRGKTLVGTCAAFFTTPLGTAMHSHIAGVLPDQAGRGVGAALKDHQRAWARARGLTEITWTYDPLIARGNAYFNFHRLGVRAVEYIPDFYGDLDDGLNRGQESDRLLVSWSTTGSAPVSDPPDPAPFSVLSVLDDHRPRDGGSPPSGPFGVRSRCRRTWRSCVVLIRRRRENGGGRSGRCSRGSWATGGKSSTSSVRVGTSCRRADMRVLEVRLHVLQMPLVSPFTTSFARQTDREVLIVELHADVGGSEVVGWGECVAMRHPLYSSEYVAGAVDVMRSYLVSRLREVEDLTAETFQGALAHVVGHRMAKGALEMAVLDARASCGRRLAGFLPRGHRRPSPVRRLGRHPGLASTSCSRWSTTTSIRATQRIKLKIQPGWDVEPVRAVRAARSATICAAGGRERGLHPGRRRTPAPARRVRTAAIEQPLGEDDLRQHAELASRLADTDLPGRVGDVGQDRRRRDRAGRGAGDQRQGRPGRWLPGGPSDRRAGPANGVPVWCGGMLETGIGRAANAALAALPGFTLPGDMSASARFYTATSPPPSSSRTASSRAYRPRPRCRAGAGTARGVHDQHGGAPVSDVLDIVVRGGTVVSGGASEVVDLGIRAGKVAQVGGPMHGLREIDARGLVVLPGLVDPHVHLSSPEGMAAEEPEFVDDFHVGSLAAIAGGVTTFGQMSFPLGDEGIAAAVERDAAACRNQAAVDYFLHPATVTVAADTISELRDLAARGHRSLKLVSLAFDWDRSHPDQAVKQPAISSSSLSCTARTTR